MFDLLKKKAKEKEADIDNDLSEHKPAPGTNIYFHPELIDQLKGDHKELVELYMEIKSLFEAESYKTVSEKLGDFRAALQGHLLTENVRLYIYLDHMFQGDETNSELIRGFRKDMGDIAKAVMSFLKKYEEIGVNNDLASQFDEDFATIGKVLTKRIENEETVLYPLYSTTH